MLLTLCLALALALAANSANASGHEDGWYILLGPRNAPNNDLKKFPDKTASECKALCNKETLVGITRKGIRSRWFPLRPPRR